jgi:hypothetical protein
MMSAAGPAAEGGGATLCGGARAHGMLLNT